MERINYTFDLPALRELRCQEDPNDVITITIKNDTDAIKPDIKININHLMDWKVFARLMESFYRTYIVHKLTMMNELMEVKG